MNVKWKIENVKGDIRWWIKLYKKKRATGGILRLLLTNPLNSQLDTNVANPPKVKKWFCVKEGLIFGDADIEYLIKFK